MTSSVDTVSDHLARLLAEDGPRRPVFTLMGEDTCALITSLVDEHRVDVFQMRHESAGVMAADSYAWATGDVGVCILSHGPGFTNGLTAAVTATRWDRGVLIVAGDDAVESSILPEIKRADQRGYAQAAGLSFVPVRHPDELGSGFAAALAHAQNGRPAVLSIAVDVLNGPGPPEPPTLPERAQKSPVLEPAQADIDTLVELLLNAERPLLVAGRGALHARDDLLALAERTGALVGTSLLGKGLFDGHPFDIGVVGGWASDGSRPLLDEFDVAVVFGASLNSFTMAFGRLFKGAYLAQVDVDPSHIGAHYPVQLGIVGEAGAVAARLLAAVAETRADAELHRPDVLARVAQPLYLGEDETNDVAADPRIVATVLDELLPRERTIVTDSGHFMGFPGMYMRVHAPNHFRITTQFASIGLGIGAAIGAAVARPDEQTLFVAGDGGLMMSLGELETIARYELPMLIVVMNDAALGSERHILDMMGIDHHLSVYGNVDFAAVARALGIDGRTIQSPDELRALGSEISGGLTKPMLIDCKIRGDIRARWLEETHPQPEVETA